MGNNRAFAYKLFQINGLYFEFVDTPKDKEYLVKMVERKGEDKHVIYETSLKKGMWAKCNRNYLSDYWIEVWDGDQLKENISFIKHMKNKRVFVSFESQALGDSIAWMHYCLEFKKTYGCEVVVSTFKNFLFESVYPELKFVGRGVVVNDICAMYEVGWFYDADKEPALPNTIPLQKAASNILGLDYQELRPRIAFTPGNNLYGRYVTISTRSTAQCKHWYYWQELVNALIEKGYKVVELSEQYDVLEGVIYPEDKSIENVMSILHHSHLYIGLSSGISWLAWALEKPVAMISNFTQEDHEFTCIRIVNKKVCNSCWNNPAFRFNKGDWNWCPEHEDTPRHFECHKQILAADVISALSGHI